MTTDMTCIPSLEDWKNWQTRDKLLLALPERVWRLVNCEIAQSVQRFWIAKYPNDCKPQQAINLRLKWCRNPESVTEKELAASSAAWAASSAAWAASSAASAAASAASAAWAASSAVWAASSAANNYKITYAIYLLALPTDWDWRWNTFDVVSLAESIYEDDCDPISFRVLADALEDAGCDDERILTSLRSEDSILTRAHVAVWKPLGLD